MRIKAWVVTGMATVLAGTACGIIVATNDPYTAEPLVRGMFWVALGLAIWGFWITLLLACLVNLARSIWIGLALDIGLTGAALLWGAGYHDSRLLGGLVFATLCVSFFIWHRYRG